MAQDKLWNKEYLKVMFANFALSFAFFLLTPLLPLYLSEEFDATKDMIGFVLSGYTLMALLARPFSGFIVDSYPRKKVLFWCFLAFFILFGGYLCATTLLLFTIVRTLHGAPFGAATVSVSTVAIDVLPSARRTEGIGYFGLSSNLAMATAPSVGVFIYQYTKNFDLLFWLAFLTALFSLIIVGTLNLAPNEIKKDVNRRKVSLDRFFLTRGWEIAVNMAFFGICFGILTNYLAIYSRDVMGITGGTGTFFMLLAIGLIASRLQGGRALRQGRLTRNAIEGTILSSIGYSLFVLFPNEWGYYASALFIGLGNGHIWPALQNMILAMAQHNQRGTANSTILISWDIGIGIGALLGGIVAEYIGYRTAFSITAITQIIGMIFLIVVTKGSFLKKRLDTSCN